MEEITHKLLSQKINEIERIDAEIKEKEQELANLSNNQNDVFEKLMKGYQLSDSLIEYADGFINPEDFVKSLQEVDSRYKTIFQGSFADKFEKIKYSEQYLSELIALSGMRWNTICQEKEEWRNQRYFLKYQENNINSNNITEKDNLIKEQQKYIAAEKEAIRQLELIYQLRENIYNQAVELYKA